MEPAETEDGILGGLGELSVKLPVFEGPLDLLLFLLKKNEIDIYDIPIEQITKQYVGVLRAMKDLSLDVAGEFFVMAATLMYIKSRMLLPSDERLRENVVDDDEDVDPRWELVEQLLEYKKIKQGAALLEDLIATRRDCLARIPSKTEETDERPLKNSDRIEVWNTFNNVLRRLAEKLVEGEIIGEQISVSDRMEHLLTLEEGKEISFSSLFEEGKTTVPLLIATFLAVLELTRLRRLDVTQDESFSEIYIKKLSEPVQEAPSQNSIEADLSTWEGDSSEPTDEPEMTEEEPFSDEE